MVVLVLVVGKLMLSDNASPDQIALRSLECLRQGDFDGLKNCYTSKAWAVVKKILPSTEDIEALKQRMVGVKTMSVAKSSINGNRAEVQVVFEHDQDTEKETFNLTKTFWGWRID